LRGLARRASIIATFAKTPFYMRWLTVFSKEVKENMRDRRTMLTTFVVSPLMGPVLLAVLMAVMLNLERDRAEKPLEIPVVGAQFAPNFVQFLNQHGAIVKPGPEKPEAAIQSRDFDAILRISPEFPKQWREGSSASVEILYDPSRQTAMRTISRVQSLVEGYSRQVGMLRLLARGVNPETTRPIELRQTDLSTPESRSSQVLSILPYMLFLTLFISGMSMAIDATAGERERQSLEPLLINPLARGDIMFGKVAASAAFSLVSLALTLALYLVGFKLVPLEQFGMKLALNWQGCVAIFVLLIPLAVIASAAQTTLAAFSKSFREAQSQVSLLMLVPGLPSMMLAVNPIKPLLWFYSIPFFGHNFIIERVVRGEAIEWLPAVIATVCASVMAIALLLLASQMYKRESLAVSA
jgi:sodium transport system permease protein